MENFADYGHSDNGNSFKKHFCNKTQTRRNFTEKIQTRRNFTEKHNPGGISRKNTNQAEFYLYIFVEL